MLDVNEIKDLIKTIDDSQIDEFTYETNGTLIQLKKSKEKETVKYTVQPTEEVIQNVQVEEVQQEEKVKDENVKEVETQIDFDYEIVSPMVGTLYEAPSPDSEPFVTVGSKVESDTIVCIVEAMKLFNEIEAEVNGEIVEVLVEDGELVEFGQPLFRVKTT